ncbi:unnamed protein product [Brachionus calyciflorus]|uniref:UBA domain-containing protein n=1 Tax=Brachionus calyciflorus TaxID=104777 RepID=A0A813UCJ0_9BILA|nr:unnamed protein product [Brachionus calyciflorus]
MFKRGIIQIFRRFSSNQTENDLIKLTLYTKKNCSLCDQAKEIIEDSYPDTFEIEEVDITKDRELFRKFKLDIPVFYFKDQFLMQHKVDKTALDKLIKNIMSLKVLVKNLNVSLLEKNFKKEFESINSNLSVDDLLSLICQNSQIEKSNLSLIYRGEVLNKNKAISEYLNNINLACLYLSEAQELKIQKSTASKAEISSLVNHIISLFRRKIRRNILEKLLLDQTKLNEVFKSLPELKNDPFSLNFVQNYDLLKLLCDGKKAEEIMNLYPNIYFGTKILVDYIRELSKKIPADENFISKGSYTIDEMSEDEEQQPAYSMPQPRQTNQPAVSQDYLSAVLSLLNQQQRPQQNPPVQTPQQAQPSQSVQPPSQQSQYPVLDRNYFQNLMQQITSNQTQAQPSSQQTSQPQASSQQTPQPMSDGDLANKLEQMHELGFLDDELNLRALQVADGNIEVAISFIIENSGM